jgi:hypothetical protein
MLMPTMTMRYHTRRWRLLTRCCAAALLSGVTRRAWRNELSSLPMDSFQCDSARCSSPDCCDVQPFITRPLPCCCPLLCLSLFSDSRCIRIRLLCQRRLLLLPLPPRSVIPLLVLLPQRHRTICSTSATRLTSPMPLLLSLTAIPSHRRTSLQPLTLPTLRLLALPPLPPTTRPTHLEG